MRRWTLPLIAIALVSSTATSGTEPRLAQLDVSLRPEYDRPAVLVILHGWLAPDAALPATVRLPMPVQAGKPHAVAKRTPDGRLLLASHTVDVKGDWAMVNVMTDVPEVRLEYYVDLARADPERRFVFEWPGGIDVERVTYEVVGPVDAENLSVKPPGRQAVGADGLTYYTGDLGPKAGNESFSIGVTYTKTSPGLSAVAPERQVPPVGQTSGATSAAPVAGPSGPGGASPWLLALAVGSAAALAGIWVFMASRKREEKRKRVGRRGPSMRKGGR